MNIRLKINTRICRSKLLGAPANYYGDGYAGAVLITNNQKKHYYVKIRPCMG